jgi:hypothetical protein
MNPHWLYSLYTTQATQGLRFREARIKLGKMREGVKSEGRHAGGLLSLLCDTLNLHQPRCDTAGFWGRGVSKHLQHEQKDNLSGLERDSSHLGEVSGNAGNWAKGEQSRWIQILQVMIRRVRDKRMVRLKVTRCVERTATRVDAAA